MLYTVQDLNLLTTDDGLGLGLLLVFYYVVSNTDVMNLKNLSPYGFGGMQLILLPYLKDFRWYSSFFLALYTKLINSKSLPKHS